MSKVAKQVGDQITDKANDTIASLESNLRQAEETLRAVSASASEVAEELGIDLKEQAAGSVSAVEDYIREKPLQSAGIAFGVGLFASMLLRRKS
jgi:ElaB/YqjD/DUF883 family membrane-anchored ribosome-binding protein